ncbi:MAG: FAD-binding oxidoreductase, partial [Acidobacteria bacterium]|nr:FAD-binding oxidoreductase [Acidobacteriota bacterium]
ATLEAALVERQHTYPPATTFTGAFIGGTVATNAAGAATFKYGTTREWVNALTVVLASGDALDIRRGECAADPDGYFEIETAAGTTRVPIPTYRMPDVPKRSAGYHAAPEMDLIDLFIGSEGTLGVVTEVELRIARSKPAAWLLVPCPTETAAILVAGELRLASQHTWRTADPNGIDVAAIENIDRRCIDLLREDGADRKHSIPIPAGTDTLLLVQVELQPGVTTDTLFDQIAAFRDPDPPDAPMVRLCGLLDAAGVLDATEIAGPDQRHRIEQFAALREAVPAAVNQRIGAAKAARDSRIQKTAADMIVPFHHFPDMMAVYRERFESRGLDYAIWGHISDGNVHPNVLPRSYEDVESGRAAILEIGRQVIGLGGCPLAEHGVGRNPIKQALLRELYGGEGIEQMRAVKRALDPEWKLAPGVIFPPPAS